MSLSLCHILPPFCSHFWTRRCVALNFVTSLSLFRCKLCTWLSLYWFPFLDQALHRSKLGDVAIFGTKRVPVDFWGCSKRCLAPSTASLQTLRHSLEKSGMAQSLGTPIVWWPMVKKSLTLAFCNKNFPVCPLFLSVETTSFLLSLTLLSVEFVWRTFFTGFSRNKERNLNRREEERWRMGLLRKVQEMEMRELERMIELKRKKKYSLEFF